MPIRPEMKALYPPEWSLISDYIRFDRAMGRCECDGRCGGRFCQARLGITARCPNYHGDPNVVTGSKVVLTTAHLDNDPPNCDPGNLLALCQQCHLSLDRDLHAATRAANREKRDNQMSLLNPGDFPDGPAQLELPKIPVFENDGQAIAWFGTDGLRWTAAFLHAADLANAGPDFVGTVHGWFCNAIEAGRSAPRGGGFEDGTVKVTTVEHNETLTITAVDEGADRIGQAIFDRSMGHAFWVALGKWLESKA